MADSDFRTRPPAAKVLDLERFRGYLQVLAHMNLQKSCRAKLDASDVVQQALLSAHQEQAKFRGQSDGELAAWLRSILAAQLGKATRAFRQQKRDLNREHPLQADLNASSAQLEAWLVADQTSPSSQLQRQEQLNRLASAVSRLSERHRQVLLLRHCQGQTLADIARHLECVPSSVVGLLHRASRQLRELLSDEQ